MNAIESGEWQVREKAGGKPGTLSGRNSVLVKGWVLVIT